MPLDLVTVGAVCADVMVRPVEALPPRGQLALVPTLEMHVGGLAGVTAAIFCQLGGRAAFVGRVGADSFGDYIVSTLEQSGVDVRGVRRDSEHRSSASIVMVSGDGERTFLHHLGTNATTSTEDLDLEQIAQARVLHWGGPSLCPLLDGEPIARVFQEARKRGVKTSMDTCYDGKGTWLPLIEPSLPHLDIVFSSLEEARKFTGQQEPEAIADFYLGYGVRIAVIKLGDQGMFIKSADGDSIQLPAHSVHVVDTTGAGDAACGGFLYGFTQGWDLERCGKLANAVGGLTVQRMGGAEAIRSLDETLAFMEGGSCLATSSPR